jgi:hypothetical protein
MEGLLDEECNLDEFHYLHTLIVLRSFDLMVGSWLIMKVEHESDQSSSEGCYLLCHSNPELKRQCRRSSKIGPGKFEAEKQTSASSLSLGYEREHFDTQGSIITEINRASSPRCSYGIPYCHKCNELIDPFKTKVELEHRVS